MGIRFLVVILSVIIFLISGLLLVFPPVGTIIGSILILLVLTFNINIWWASLSLKDRKLTYSSLFTTKEINLQEMISVANVIYFALDASRPFAIRKVILMRKDGETENLPTIYFPWYRVLDLVHTLNTEYFNE